MDDAIVANVDSQSVVYKGKRTKRLRPYSPISYALPEQQQQQQQQVSPTSPLEFGASSETTEEEEDMANCLILLAQGHFSNPPPHPHPHPLPLPLSLSLPPLPRQAAEDQDYHINNNQQGYKYSSRRYMPAEDTSGKAGYYVYQCKTCDRTFSSFQALGGHRASHKKPKATAAGEDPKKAGNHLALSSEDDEARFMIKNTHNVSSSLSLQLSNTGFYTNKVNKVHECSICGAEFTSGQALGGHMRRHRGTIPTATATATTLSLTPPADYSDQNREQPINKKPRNVVSLDLDLNLPAPDDQEPNKFLLASDQQKPPLALSAAAMVDCHY